MIPARRRPRAGPARAGPAPATGPPDPTVAVYEARARDWADRRRPSHEPTARRLAREVGRRGPIADLGCGPGWHTAALGPGAVALDAAGAMLDLVADHAPGAPRVQADLRALPFRRGALYGALAARSYVHLARRELPLALADLHRSLAIGAPAQLILFGGDQEHDPYPDDDFAGRRFSAWPQALLDAVVEGAGFEQRSNRTRPARGDLPHIELRLRRARTLADTVGPDMVLLVVGLNPSLYAADVGVGFARPGNRFWPAALQAGIVTRDRDPHHALVEHGVGMTDLVKRATPRAAELRPDEYRHGVDRLARLVGWLAPAAVGIVGLTGWRAAVDRHAVAGWQPEPLGGRPVYVLPNPSGLNAHTTVDELATHLRMAHAGPHP